MLLSAVNAEEFLLFYYILQFAIYYSINGIGPSGPQFKNVMRQKLFYEISFSKINEIVKKK